MSEFSHEYIEIFQEYVVDNDRAHLERGPMDVKASSGSTHCGVAHVYAFGHCFERSVLLAEMRKLI